MDSRKKLRLRPPAVSFNRSGAVLFLSMFAVSLLWLLAGYNDYLLSERYSGVTVYPDGNGISASQMDALTARLPRGEGSARAVALEQLGGETVTSLLGNSATLMVYKTHGDMTAVLPLEFIQGGQSGIPDNDSCVVDKHTAYKLFGTSRAVGLSLEYGGRSYVVTGVADGDTGIVLLQSNDSQAIYKTLRFVFDDPNSAGQRATELCLRNGITPKACYDSQLAARNAGLLMQAPALMLVLALLIGTVAEVCSKKNGATYRVMKLFGGATLVMLVWLACGISISIPTEYLPTGWSELSHWSQLRASLDSSRTALSYQLPLPTDTVCRRLFQKSAVLSMISSVMILLPAVHRKKLMPKPLSPSMLIWAAGGVLAAWSAALLICEPFIVDRCVPIAPLLCIVLFKLCCTAKGLLYRISDSITNKYKEIRR